MCTPEIVMTYGTKFSKQWESYQIFVSLNICKTLLITYHVNTSIPTPGKHLNAVPTNIIPPVKSIEFRRPEVVYMMSSGSYIQF